MTRPLSPRAGDPPATVTQALTLAERRLVYCHRNGHSNILKGCFGYMTCARCDTQIGDSIGGGYRNLRAVIVGHACEHCKANYPKLTKADTHLVPPKILRALKKELQ